MKFSTLTFGLTILLALGGVTSAKAQSSHASFRDQFKSSVLEFDGKGTPLPQNSSGRYPVAISYIFNNLAGWTPDGKKKNHVGACQPDRLISSSEFPGNLGPCTHAWETGENSIFQNITKIMAIRLHHDEHPFLHPLTVHLPGDIKLRGILAIKGDLKKRPLVIIRNGIFSGTRDFIAERAWYMMLFEQAPFNVLVLENLTSTQFIENNIKFSFGGFDEGLQNIWLAQQLQSKKEPLSKIIDSVHIFGVSLGGHGTLYASLLNKYNSPPNKPLIRSFIALCPVADLKTTMMQLVFSGGIKSAIIDLWGRQRIGVVEKKMTIENYPSFSFLYSTVEEVSKTYKGPLLRDSKLKLPPGQKTETDFWTLNNFWPYYEGVREPVYIFTTEYDPAVPYPINTAQIKTTLSTPEKTTNIRNFTFKHGVHCTLPVAYDWGSLSEMFRALILKNSPQFKMQQKSAELALPAPGFEPRSWSVEHIDFEKGTVEIDFKLKKNEQIAVIKATLKMAEFDFVFHDKKSSEDLTALVKRWLYLNLKEEVQNDKLRLSWSIAH